MKKRGDGRNTRTEPVINTSLVGGTWEVSRGDVMGIYETPREVGGRDG